MPTKPIFEKDELKRTLLLKAIKLGMSNLKACEYAGITEQCFYLWQQKAENDEENGLTSEESKYVEFFEEVKKARATCQINHLSLINNAAASGNWQASAWILERRFPNDFAQKQQVSVENEKISIICDIPNKEEE